MKKESKTFYACVVPEKSLEEARGNFKSLPDMFHILLHNQTILNEKLNKLFNKLNI